MKKMATTKQISIVTSEDGTLESIGIAVMENGLPISAKMVDLPELSKIEIDEIKSSNLLIETKAK
jgi:hypothetical protein